MICLDIWKINAASGLPRLSVAPGTRIASDLDFPNDYAVGARIVAAPFETVADWPSALVPGTAGRQAHSTVALITVEPDIVASLRQAHALCSSPDERSRGERLLAETLHAWRHRLPQASGWQVEGRLNSAGFWSAPRPRAHTTTDRHTGRRVGLHIDNWDRLPPRDRSQAANRVCINIGTSPRAFMFVPRQACHFADDLAAVGIDIDNDPQSMADAFGVRSLARRYLEVFPKVEVFRVSVMPGEAYIAPTENIIHDGYADHGPQDDTALTLRGRFAPIG